MPYTLAEAAQACGVNRSTILRAIKSGRISGQRDDAGVWSVEPAELHRVFPAEAANKPLQQDAHADALVTLLREQLAEMRGQRDEMKGERDAWRGIAERLTNALPKPVGEPPKPKPKQTLWQWLKS
jgi:hypothetical protein